MASFPFETGLLLAGALFILGLVGVLVRRNLVFILLSIEIMLNAAGLAFIVAGARWKQADGQVMFIFLLAVAAAEVAVGLALLLRHFSRVRSLDSDTMGTGEAEMLSWIWLVPALPFLGFLVLAIFGRRFALGLNGTIGAGSVGLSFAVAAAVALSFITNPPAGTFSITLWQWVAVAGFTPSISFTVDALSIVMILVVTGVGFLIHLYSTRFMKEEEGYHRFFAYMNLFVGSMLVLVLAANLLLLYLGWEGVGLCSYLLIGFWYSDPENGVAARKAFIVTRIGDVSLAIAVFLIATTLGTLDFGQISAKAPGAWPVGSALAVATAALILGGAVGKSAQLPLQTWLPDAMAGPTPVSALIHAATMVTAGVYLIARTNVLFSLAPAVQTATAVIGAAGLLIAGYQRNDPDQHQARPGVLHHEPARLHVPGARGRRLVRRHLPPRHPRLLQVSPLHGSRSRDPGHEPRARHLPHGRPGAEDAVGVLDVPGRLVRPHGHPADHGGLRQQGPHPCPGVAGRRGRQGAVGGRAGRCFLHGGLHVPDALRGVRRPAGQAPAGTGPRAHAAEADLAAAHRHGHAAGADGMQSGGLMGAPLGILALLCIVGGLINFPSSLGGKPILLGFLGTALPPEAGGEPATTTEVALAIISEVVSLLGIPVGWLLARREKAIEAARPGQRTAIAAYLKGGWGFDWLYDRALVRPFEWLARINVRDVVNRVFDDGVGGLSMLLSRAFRLTQNGRVRWYAAGLVGGAVLVVAAVVLL